MSELTRARRNRIIGGVLAIGLLVGIAEIVVYDLWADWTIEVFTPVAGQIMLLTYGIFAIWYGDWVEAAWLLPFGILFFVGTSTIALLPALVRGADRKTWAGLTLVLLLLASAVSWKTNWQSLRWGEGNHLRVPFALLNGLLIVVCLIAWLCWRRNPNGKAAFWYPATLQLWIQSLWIALPEDD